MDDRKIRINPLDAVREQWLRERPDSDVHLFTIPAAIKQLDTRFEIDFRALAARYGIGSSELRVLFALRRQGVDNPQRPTSIFQSLLITSGAVTKQVDRLLQKNLVERVPSSEGSRKHVKLTEAGCRVADDAFDRICSDRTRIGRAVLYLPEEERAAGLAFLKALIGRMDELLATDEEPDPSD